MTCRLSSCNISSFFKIFISEEIDINFICFNCEDDICCDLPELDLK